METWKPTIPTFSSSEAWSPKIVKDSDDFNAYGVDPRASYPWILVDGEWYLDASLWWIPPRDKCGVHYIRKGTTLVPLICVGGNCYPPTTPPGEPIKPPVPPTCGQAITIGGVGYPGTPCPACCSSPQPLIISGPEAYTNLSDYEGIGGCGPYTLTSPSGSCGVSTVTITDACGNTASLQVRMPTGVWKLVSDTSPTSGVYYGCFGSITAEAQAYIDANSLVVSTTTRTTTSFSQGFFIGSESWGCQTRACEYVGYPRNDAEVRYVGPEYKYFCSSFSDNVGRLDVVARTRVLVEEWWCTSTTKGW